MNSDYSYRPLSVDDEDLLWSMLALAAHEPLIQTVRDNPALACYVKDWGRSGDSGFATLNESGECIGAAWLRLWPGHERGFAYFDEATPELAMAVAPEFRGLGIGTELLRRVLREADEQYPVIALSVRTDNPVMSLYERVGFEIVRGSEIVNRTGGVSVNMMRRTA